MNLRFCAFNFDYFFYINYLFIYWIINIVDRHEESKGIVVQVPLNQQIIVQQPKEEEKVNPLVAFFRKLKHIKNSIFSHHSDKKEEDEEEHKDHKISTVFVYTHPSKHGHYPWGTITN